MSTLKAIDSLFFGIEDEVTIYEGDFDLESKNKYCHLNGTISFSFKPKPSIRFVGESEEVIISNIIEEKNITLLVPGMLPTRVSLDLVQNDYLVKGQVLYQIENDEDPYVESYYSHVNSFVKYIGDSIYRDNFCFRGGITIDYEDWDIKLHMRHDFKDKNIFSKLEDSDGHNITHVIEIKKKDGIKFRKSEASKIEEIFVWVFCLCAGRHIGMPIKIGIKGNDIVYRNFAVPLMSSYRKVPNWFPKQQGKVLKDLFYNISAKFEDNFTKRVIKETIHWYVEALNSTFIENRAVNAQIALEKLSYVLLTQQSTKIISNNEFKSNSFQANLQRILDEISVDTRLTGDYSMFSQHFGSGPHLLVKYRNHITHPKRNQNIDSYSASEKFLINQLGLYYTEMLLLYLIGYGNVFSNRLNFPSWEGIYDSLPWKK
ncbi:hypothetical protein [Lentibacillus sp. CBA3610]|uniref:hypothetical protein n=1 Tax=Lentibacillus sp. CBA3610 TaxID=2518176 RepID=UPI00159603D1|nr:hypothetical protein [Lentibacillus sp. CBA3610]QKY70604.1 hypothetical protein Len3610_14295 [Lentibacillus sp. CBA3610]